MTKFYLFCNCIWLSSPLDVEGATGDKGDGLCVVEGGRRGAADVASNEEEQEGEVSWQVDETAFVVKGMFSFGNGLGAKIRRGVVDRVSPSSCLILFAAGSPLDARLFGLLAELKLSSSSIGSLLIVILRLSAINNRWIIVNAHRFKLNEHYITPFCL